MGDDKRLDEFRYDTAFLSDDPSVSSADAPMWAGALSFCRRPYARRLDGVDLAVVGVPYDLATSGRPGARLGPRAVRAASSNLAWSRLWPSPFDPFETLRVVDWGDVGFDQGRPDRVPAEMEAAFRHIVGSGAGALMLGGDHFCTYPALKAAAERQGGPLALIQFDAHGDTWSDAHWARGGETSPRIDHGTMFRRGAEEGLIDAAHSIQVGLRTINDEPMEFEILDANKVHRMTPEAVAEAVKARVGDRPCYLTFDIDCLDPAFAPGTGTPVCGGLSSWFAKEALRGLAGVNLVGMDVVEVAPSYDVSEITALAGATLALEMVCLYAHAKGKAPAA